MPASLDDPAGITPLDEEVVALGGRIRAKPEDFLVEEIPLVRPAGRGTHVLFQIEKREMSTFEAILRVSKGAYTLTTKLVDGKFPDYEKVVPKDAGQAITGDRESMKQAFTRASILSNEKYRGVRLTVDGELMTIQANNPEQEEAEEVIAVDYQGEPLEIGFNVSYLQDVLSVLGTEQVQISVSDANSSALIEGMGNDDAVYVVMPMRL